MFIRSLTREDIPACVDIAHECFSKDELFKWMFPHQEKYPEDLRRFQAIRIRQRFVELGNHSFVMVTEESDSDWTGVPDIAGFTFWVRYGDDEAGKKWRRDSWLRKIEHRLLSWEMSYESRVLSRILDREHQTLFSHPEHWKIIHDLPAQWHLASIAVREKYGRRGVGGRLLQQGLEFAEQERLPVTLNASVKGRGLYTKHGFKVMQKKDLGGGVLSVLMIWEPEGLQREFVQEVGEGMFINTNEKN